MVALYLLLELSFEVLSRRLMTPVQYVLLREDLHFNFIEEMCTP